MLERLPDLPENVVAVRASGEISADDYERVLVPAIEETLAAHRRVRLLYVFGPGFEGFSAGAAWEDTKVGMRHLTAWDRIAVVTDVDWIESSVKAVGFALPCEVRVFEGDELAEARAWITESLPHSALAFEVLREERVLVLRPSGELEAGDFERVAAAIDPMIEEGGALEGLMIVAERFPGWDDFAAFASHLRFVKHHHRDIRRIAIVTDDKLFALAPHLARHFVAAEVRHFAGSDETEARAWLTGG